MRTEVKFLSTGRGFHEDQIAGYGHGFLMARHSERVEYILFASRRYPAHEDLQRIFEENHSDYVVLGGGSVVKVDGNMRLLPVSLNTGYIPMRVAHKIVPVVQQKLKDIGIEDELTILSHEDIINQKIKRMFHSWADDIKHF